jgi:hypothetical protein
MAVVAGASPAEMIEYRLYFVGDDGRFNDFRAFASVSDEDALIQSKQIMDGQAVELWSGARFVARLEPAKPGYSRSNKRL